MADWTKDGSIPGPLPAQDADSGGRIWTNLPDNVEGRQACGWTEAPDRPAPAPGEVVAWIDGAWVVEPEAAPQAAPLRIAKYWLLQRFSDAQERAFAKLEYQARSMTPAQIDDPANEGLYQLQRFLRRLDALTVVELDAPQTQAGFELLRLLGVFGDPAFALSSAAMVEILAPPGQHEAA